MYVPISNGFTASAPRSRRTIANNALVIVPRNGNGTVSNRGFKLGPGGLLRGQNHKPLDLRLPGYREPPFPTNKKADQRKNKGDHKDQTRKP